MITFLLVIVLKKALKKLVKCYSSLKTNLFNFLCIYIYIFYVH